jgi:hypothetical protein
VAYSAFGQAIHAARCRAGVEVIGVKIPRGQSLIGSVNHPARFGLSVRLAAAVAIATRGVCFSETPAGRLVATPMRRPCHRASTGAESQKHVWSVGAEVSSARTAARASAFPVE